MLNKSCKSNWVNYFTPDNLSALSAEHTKYIYRSTSLLTTMLISTCFFIVCLFMNFRVGAIVCFTYILGHLFLLYGQKKSFLSAPFIAHFFGIMTAPGFTMTAIFSGGTNSSVLYWYIAILVISFWFGSRRDTLLWAAISVLCILGILLGDKIGFNYPVTFNLDNQPYFKTLVSSGLILYLSVVLVTFDRWRQAAIEELKTLNRTKDRMLAMIAHDLNNPLAVYQINTDLLREGAPLSEKVLSTFESLNQKMKVIIENLVLFDKLLSKKFVKNYEECSLKKLFTQLNSEFEAMAMLRKIKIHLCQEDVTVFSDPKALDRIFTNIISNALKYTPSNKSIFITWNQQGVIEIKDEGIGFAPEMIENVFRPYEQRNETIHAIDGSHGIGLSIVKSLCDELGLKISVSSPGKDLGSTFRIVMPKTAFK